MPKVSVIIPVYKVEKTLERCVKSVTEQTFQDIEIILVDDGSPDNCPMMCEELAKTDERIKVVHKENGGLGFARNSGLDTASGEYIGYVDSDDYIDREMYAKMIAALEKNHADTCYCGYFKVNGGEILKKIALTEKETVFSGQDEIKHLLMDFFASDISQPYDNKYGATVWKGLFSRKIIEDNHIRFYSEREYASEDGLYDIDYFPKAQKIVLIPDCCYYYTYNPDSLTAIYREGIFDKNVKLFQLSREKLWNSYHDESIQIQYGRKLVTAARTGISQEIKNSARFGFQPTLDKIHTICRNEVLRSVLEEYPWQKLPLKKKLFAGLTKGDKALLLYLLGKLQYH